MKLVKARITNFRSIEDSGEFDVFDLLCLVGKNEAGKTAVQQALGGLNPHPSTPLAYDVERDYPRRWLADYKEQHPDEEATVVTTKWTLTDDERMAITEVLGDGVLKDEPIVITRRYGDKEPHWTLPLNYRQGIENLIAIEALDDEEAKPLEGIENSRDVIEALRNL